MTLLQETHIMHNFGKDLYNSELKLCICGWLRPQENFDSLEALIAAIEKDKKDAEEQLDTEPFKAFKTNDFFFK